MTKAVQTVSWPSSDLPSLWVKFDRRPYVIFASQQDWAPRTKWLGRNLSQLVAQDTEDWRKRIYITVKTSNRGHFTS